MICNNKVGSYYIVALNGNIINNIINNIGATTARCVHGSGA